MVDVKFSNRRIVVWLLAATVATAGPATAQRATVPAGSPLQGTNDRDQDQDQERRTATVPVIDPTGGGSPVGETKISDDPRNLANIDRSAELLNVNRAGMKAPAEPNEFERYVERALGRKLPRFGTELLLPASRDFATPATAAVPPDYLLNPGDVISIYMTGSVEGSVEREIDNEGKIFLPKVGEIRLAGIRYADLRDRISAAIGRQYRGYDVTVGIRRLRGIRVYVTGFANNPGAFTVSSLSTMANAVFAAGGPSSGGSFRSVKLYRHGAEVADFDLYELVRGGSRLHDAVLQNEDVLFIPPAGPQVAVVGSVNDEAIYEAKPGETLDDVLRYAGGPNSLGDTSRVILYRSSDNDQVGPRQIDRRSAATIAVAGADILQVLSKGTLTQPIDRQSVLVRIEGEVNRPGNYYVAPNTPLSDVMAKAGGLTPRAFAYGTRLQRLSVKEQQRESYAEAIKQLELTLAASPLTQDQSQSAGERQMQLAGARQVLERLRTAEPDGRVVLDISPAAMTLPADVLLENNDQIYVPPRATTVGVFGAVYRPASFYLDGRQPLRVRDYIDRAGGTLRAADTKGIFVVRANGEVLPQRRGALKARVLPGDVVFVPVKTQSGAFWSRFKDLTTTLFQIGLSAATVSAVID
jgi:protein involved in polysaccharide export with SLBB domain